MKLKRHRHHAIRFVLCCTKDPAGKVIKSRRTGECKCGARRVDGKWLD